MDFQKQQIVIPLQNKKDGTIFDRIVDATIGVGSGLAYHHPQLSDDESADFYTITHLASGLNVGLNMYFAETEQEAQKWLELVAQITDWKVGREGVIQASRGINIRQQIEDALEQAHEDVENATSN